MGQRLPAPSRTPHGMDPHKHPPYGAGGGHHLKRGGPNTIHQIMGHFGPFLVVLPPLNPMSGALWGKTLIWPYLGLRGSSRTSEGILPTFCGPNTTLDTSSGLS